MKKLGLIKRLFWSTTKITEYLGGSSNESVSAVKEVYEQRVTEFKERIEELRERITSLQEDKAKFEHDSKNATAALASEKSTSSSLREQIARITSEVNVQKEESRIIKNEIRDQLKTINKIERTFFSTTGNKGKGELGEQQVKTILEKSGLSKDMWVTNLTVGNNTVEFAMQSGEEGKYIPIDSKVLDTDLDDEGKIVIDDRYRSKVKAAAKEINKYLDKSNTAGYGILVLQSDSIYMKLFEEYPTFFHEMLDEYKIHINSPSSFVQTAWSISNLINIYNRIRNDEKIYDDMISALETISKFGSNMQKIHSNFNTAMNQYSTIEKKHSNLVKRLDKEGKLKALPELKGGKDE